MQKIIIIGNAISADIIYSYLKQDDRYTVVSFAVDKEYITTNKKFDLPVVDLVNLKKTYSIKDHKIIIGVGYKNLNKNRETLFHRVKEMGYTVETYIHPDAKIFNNHQIGEGSIILANTVVEPFAVIKNNSYIWANCTIGHHATVGNNCWIASGSVIAGESSIGNNCFLGIKVSVANQVTVEKLNIIGGHTTIQKNTKPNEVYLTRNGEKHRFDAINYANYYLA